MRAVRAALAAALLVLVARATSAEVSDYLGRTVSAVRLEIEGVGVADPNLLGVVETRAGARLSMMDVRESIAHLFSLGRFDDVEVQASRDGDRVALRYALTPIHTIARIAFDGEVERPGIDAGDLRRAIGARFGGSPSARRAGDAGLLVAEQLQARGYLRPLVTPRVLVDHASERATLTFTIVPGPRTTIGQVDITGVPEPLRRSVLGELDIVPGMPYERDALTARTDAFVARRRARGYYEAAITIGVVLVDDDRRVNLTLNVAVGPRVRVAFAGDPVPADLRETFVPIEREGSSDEDLLEDSSHRIEEYFRTLGYQDARAPYARRETGGELLLTFTVARGPQYRVSRVEVAGNASVPLGELAPMLRLREGQPFSSSAMEADRRAIELLYHRRGFAAARVDADFERDVEAAPAADPARGQPTRVRIAIHEGPQATVASVRLDGNRSVGDAELREAISLDAGQPFFPPQLAADRDRMQLLYANRGYAAARVEVRSELSGDGARADVTFAIQEGPRILVDHVLIVGNVRTRADIIERELAIKPGDPLGLEALTESQRRLSLLGLFRRTRLTELRHGDETTRDLVVTVEESPVTTVDYGGGIEAGEVLRAADDGGFARTELDLSPRAFFGIGRRNLFGKNRSINLFGRISPHLSGSTGRLTTSAGALGFTEYRLLASFREPRVFETGADASLTAVLEQQRRASFNFARQSFIAEAGRRFTPAFGASGSYQIQQTRLFPFQTIAPSEQLLIDRLFPQLRLSSASGSVTRDTRDDPIEPASGGYLSATGQVAARAIGSEVGFVKTLLVAQAFRTLPRTARVVLAGNLRVGLAAGFARDVARVDEEGNVIVGPDGAPIVDRVKDLPASERFFAGGDTMRGFALDQLGAPGTIDARGFPVGGRALLVANAELRVPLRGGLGAVGFVDAGNVFARPRDFAPGDVRTAAGFGLRYRSPIGPIRVDLGFKLQRETVAGRRERPTAIHVSLGQAF
ncbi:MAG: BamA/TamA family outer membrane protein [Acidobacteria bacterium]|nr:BamA/TamA family outer membrane protein [Acidobacteriota bacterium]